RQRSAGLRDAETPDGSASGRGSYQMRKAAETRARGAPPASRGRSRACGRRGEGTRGLGDAPVYAALSVRIFRFCRGRCLVFLPGRWLGALTLCFFAVCETGWGRRSRTRGGGSSDRSPKYVLTSRSTSSAARNST